MMANVMGHGGDGAGDPPPPGGWAHGHVEDGEPVCRRVRGKAKNLKLHEELKKSKGRPLELDFDREATFTPVGRRSSYFTRELGIYMWRSIAFDKEGWRNVSDSDKNALHEHLRQCFDLDSVARDIKADNIRGGIQYCIQKRYSDRKHDCKRMFLNAGGYEDVEGARRQVPEDMNPENWQRAIDHFLCPDHQRRSQANKSNRQHQVNPNRGGTSSYSNTCYQENLERVQGFFRGNTDKYGHFHDPRAEQKYGKLVDEFNTQRQELDEEGGSSQPQNVVGVFEKILGSRRGRIRGIGHKPSSTTPSTYFGSSQQSPDQPEYWSEEYVRNMFQNQHFRSQFASMSKGLNFDCEEGGDGDGDGDDEDNE